MKTKFSILGSNSNGLKAKLESLKNTVRHFDFPSAVCLQETKLRFAGKIKLEGYQTFELVRNGFGGGLLTAIKSNLSPVLVSAGKNDTELLVVQVKIGKLNVRIINGYGPQENEVNKENIFKFWQELELEVINAKEENCAILIELDANAKVGSEVIKGDPNKMSENGRLFFQHF